MSFIFLIMIAYPEQQKREETYKVDIILKDNIYKPGDTVTGKVYFENQRKLFCSQIEANLMGHVRVFWKEEKTTANSQRKNLVHEQKRVILEKTSILWQFEGEKVLNRNILTMKEVLRMASSTAIRTEKEKVYVDREEQPGIDKKSYNIPFSFDLPKEGLYNTFESRNSPGRVQYWVQVRALLRGRVVLERKVFFTVVVPQDLNDIPMAVRPIDVTHMISTEEKETVEVNVKLPKSGFCTGEHIDAIVTIHNRTKKSIKYATLNIVQQQRCCSISPTFATRETKYETPGFPMPAHKIQAGDSLSFTSLGYFRVPALSPGVSIPQFLLVDYKLQLVVGFKRAQRNSAFGKIQIPICIGTTPVEALPSYSFATDKDSGKSPQPSAPPIVHYDAPPSYEEIDSNPQNGAPFSAAGFSYH